MLPQPNQFGQFLLFQQQESNSYRSCHRAGLTRGRAIERIVRLEMFDQGELDTGALLRSFDSFKALQTSLRDPHIAAGAGLGEVDGTPYAAYDFELGTTLTAFLAAAREQSFPVPFDQALFIAERIALALAAAYQHEHDGGPVLHSFLTPDSILLSNDGEVKVCGFGVGHALLRQLADKPYAAPYLSPQCRSGQPASACDDVFSLGSILFELVTGEALSIDTLNYTQLRVQATGEPVSDRLRQLFHDSLGPPGERIPNVMDWQQALGRFILDGEYNPTTFNLSFLLHTLLREPLERGAESIQQEKRFVLPQEALGAANGASAEASTAAAPVRAETPSESAVHGFDPEGSTVTQVAASLAQPSAPEDRKPFWLGFSISGVTATALLSALLIFGGTSEEAPAKTDPTSPATRPQAAQLSRVSDSPPAAEPEPAVTDPSSSVVLTKIVNGEVGQPLTRREMEEAIAERTDEIERNLKTQYEGELESLRQQIVDQEESVSLAAPDSEPDRLTTEEIVGEPVASEPTPSADDRLEDADAKTVTKRTGAVHETLPQASSPTIEIESPEISSQRPQARLSEGGADSNDLPAATADSLPDPIPDPADNPPETAKTTEPAEAASPADEVDTPAQLLRLNPPSYPVAARRLGLSATARVKVLVSNKGKVVEARIDGPPLGGGFDRAALSAARRSRWKPALRDGQPVEAWSALTLEFQP